MIKDTLVTLLCMGNMQSISNFLERTVYIYNIYVCIYIYIYIYTYISFCYYSLVQVNVMFYWFRYFIIFCCFIMFYQISLF